MTAPLPLHRVRHALTIAPAVVAHIVSMRGSHASSDQPRVQTSKEPPAPVNESAIVDADYVYAALIHWANLFGDTIGALPPAPVARAHRDAHGDVDGFPSTITPRGARAAVHEQTTWMLRQLPRVEQRRTTGTITLETLTAFADEADGILQLRDRWGLEDDVRTSQVPCRRHGMDQARILIHPPTEYGETRVIVCDHGCYYTEPELVALTREHVEQVRREEQARSAIGRHLARKHAGGRG
jgi:hypothetical protein